eukprot:4342159-Alexandrium_andersonii.AAC.1
MRPAHRGNPELRRLSQRASGSCAARCPGISSTPPSRIEATQAAAKAHQLRPTVPRIADKHVFD